MFWRSSSCRGRRGRRARRCARPRGSRARRGLDEGSIDGRGPVPVEVGQRLEFLEARARDAAFQAARARSFSSSRRLLEDFGGPHRFLVARATRSRSQHWPRRFRGREGERVITHGGLPSSVAGACERVVGAEGSNREPADRVPVDRREHDGHRHGGFPGAAALVENVRDRLSGERAAPMGIGETRPCRRPCWPTPCFNGAAVRRRRRASSERSSSQRARSLQRSRRPKTAERCRHIRVADLEGASLQRSRRPKTAERCHVLRRRRDRQALLQRSRRPKTAESRRTRSRATASRCVASTEPPSEDGGETSKLTGWNDIEVVLQRSRRPKTAESSIRIASPASMPSGFNGAADRDRRRVRLRREVLRRGRVPLQRSRRS